MRFEASRTMGTLGRILLALSAGSSIPGLIAYTFSAFVLAAIVVEFWRGTAARRALTGEPVRTAFGRLVGRNRRRYGGYVVHAAIVLLAIGIAGSSAYDSVAEGRLARGESLAVGGYTLTYRELTERDGPNATEIRAVLDVRRGGDDLGTIAAGKNAYSVEQQVSNEVGIRSDLLTGEDLFVIAEQVRDDGAVVFRVFVKPLVNLIWLAGIVFVFGVFLVFTGIKMMLSPEKGVDPDKNLLIRLFRRFVPVTNKLHGERFFVRSLGRVHATPLFVALLFLEATDIIFAVDSVPAIFALTNEPLIVFTSNIFAILGLRALYFMLAGAIDKFYMLKFGLAVVLIFVGLKMVWLNNLFGGKFPISLSLGIITGVIAISVVLSLLFPKDDPQPSV